jgi:hypothetical protein
MKTLLDCFHLLEKHPLPMINKSYLKVKKSQNDFDYCIKFIESVKDLSFDDRQLKINRMFLDCERPKLWNNMIELIQMAHSIKGRV